MLHLYLRKGEVTTRSIAENIGVGVNIGQPIVATDGNSRDRLVYSLGGADSDSFVIVASTGQLRTRTALDYEMQSSYSVVVTVSDGNLTDMITVHNSVTNVDESTVNTAPVFSDGNSITLSIAENTGSGVNIGSAVSATDVDADALTYTLGGIDSASFSIDSTTGQIRTYASLDYETQSSYSVVVTVSDGNLTDMITVHISVTNVDESTVNTAPVFSDGDSITLSIAENTGSGVNIGSAVSATDVDADALTYTLGGIDSASFSIDSTTGQIRTYASLDYETQSSYSVVVTVSDGNLTDMITVHISVTNVDESTVNTAPVFSDGDSITLSIARKYGFRCEYRECCVSNRRGCRCVDLYARWYRWCII